MTVLVSPQERSRGQFHSDNRARGGGADQNAVGVGGRDARDATQRILINALFDDGQLLRPEHFAGGGLQRQEPNFPLDFTQHVEMAHQRQGGTEEKGLGQLQGLFSRRSADVPQWLSGADFVGRQPVARSGLFVFGDGDPREIPSHHPLPYPKHNVSRRPIGKVQVFDRKDAPAVAAECAVGHVAA